MGQQHNAMSGTNVIRPAALPRPPVGWWLANDRRDTGPALVVVERLGVSDGKERLTLTRRIAETLREGMRLRIDAARHWRFPDGCGVQGQTGRPMPLRATAHARRSGTTHVLVDSDVGRFASPTITVPRFHPRLVRPTDNPWFETLVDDEGHRGATPVTVS